MSNLQKAFSKDKKSLIVFLTAGDPSLEKTIEYVLTAEEAGADVIEIGIPFSDPVAEGVVIQNANERALAKGIKIDQIFEMVKVLRTKTKIPLVFLTYMNPVYKYGVVNFTRLCRETGIDGLIIPDLPFEERDEVLPHCQENGLDLISLISLTSRDRIGKIASSATGFIYCVSSLGVTGMRTSFSKDLKNVTNKIKAVTDTPVAIGFGISTPEQVRQLKGDADGLIVGSAVVKIIGEYGENAQQPLFDFVKSLRNSLDEVEVMR